MGDKAGGSGWEMSLADGTVENFYVDIPGDIATFAVNLPCAPSTHLGKPLADTSIQTIAQMYFEYLVEMLAHAERNFGGARR